MLVAHTSMNSSTNTIYIISTSAAFSLSDTPCKSILRNDGKIATKLWLVIGPSKLCWCPFHEQGVLTAAHIYIYIYVCVHMCIYIYEQWLYMDTIHCHVWSPEIPRLFRGFLVGKLKFEPAKTGISWARNGHTTNDGLVGDARAYLGDWDFDLHWRACFEKRGWNHQPLTV